MRKVLGIAVMAFTLGALVACTNSNTSVTEVTSLGMESGSSESASTSQEEMTIQESQMDESDYPIVLKHAFGETVIEKKPVNIVTIAWENNDTPLALGIAPVGVSAANYGMVTKNKLHPWADEAFQKLGVEKPNVFDDTAGLNFEAISDAKPDVILASYSGITKEEYETLSQIAPVLPYKDKPWQTLWRDQTIENARAMGMEKEGLELVENAEKLIQERVAKYPELSGKNAAFVMISPDDLSNFYLYLPTDPRSAYLSDLGLLIPQSVKKIAEGSDEFFASISRENADTLNDIDILITYGTSDQLEVLQADPMLSQIPAIKNGAVVYMESTSALAAGGTPSILSIPYNIDTYLNLLSEAAKKVQ